MDTEKLFELHSQGKTCQEIKDIIGGSLTTIRKYIKEAGLETNSKRSKLKEGDLEIIRNGIIEGKTNSEIANILGVSVTSVGRYIKKLDPDNTPQRRKRTLTNDVITLTKEQEEVLYGSMLGDMSMDTNWKNVRPLISQGGNQEAYFDYKCKIFENLLGKVSKSKRYDKRTNKWYNKYFIRFLTNPIYTEIKEKLYPNGIKTVSQEWLNKITPRGLAFWFMDDGTNSGTIAINSFSYEEGLLIVNWFKEKWDINCTLHKSVNNGNLQHLLYIKKESRSKFYNLVVEYFIPEMLYKLENWNP